MASISLASGRDTGLANCQAGDAVGDCVKVTGAKVAGLFQVNAVDITVNGEPPAVGIIIRKDSPTDCLVQFRGPMSGVYGGLTPGVRYFAGASAQLTPSPPAPAPAGVAYAQAMAVATSDDELQVDPQLRVKRVD